MRDQNITTQIFFLKFNLTLNNLEGQHQCNSMDFWTFFLGWGKGSKKKRFEDVFGHVFKFPGKFCHWQIFQNGGHSPAACFFAARTRTTANLKLEQKQIFFLNLYKYS